MKRLELELKNFWNWAQITPEEYEQRVPPRNPQVYPGVEWEDSYPEMQKLRDAFKSDIKEKGNLTNEEFIKLVLQAIAIDNESEVLADFIAYYLDADSIEKVFCAVLDGGLTDAQWQLASRVLHSCSKNKIFYLKKFILEGGNDYVKNRAVYALESLGLEEK